MWRILLIMNNKIFLEDHPLTLSIEKKDLEKFREVLKIVNEAYVVIFTEIKISEDITNFYIHIPTTSFANGYWYLGLLFHREIKSKANAG